jgi:predicted RNase H-like nuclease
MKHNKRTGKGINERIALLKEYESQTEQFLAYILDRELRRNVRADDILDALVAFVTSCASKSQLQNLRGLPASDEKGLPMEIVYVNR